MFPFELPAATQFYLVLYVATLVLHVVPMNYVLAGATFSVLVEVAAVFRGPREASQAMVEKIRDWLPFALAVTITAGVAPLLFIQVLYQQPFYTANLLLFHRWMAILPVLIVAFYLLYLQKSERFRTWPAVARAAVALTVIACFAFVAWSWTENHLLSLRGQAAWVATYSSPDWFYRDPELLPRLALWYLSAFPTLAVVLAWQLRSAQSDDKTAPQNLALTRRLAWLALITLLGAALAGSFYYAWLPLKVRRQLIDSATWPYLASSAGGMALQAVAWLAMLRRGRIAPGPLLAATTGLAIAVLSVTALREVRRLASLDITPFTAHHERAAQVGGWAMFLAFLLLNTLVIAGVVLLIRRGIKSGAAQ